MQCHSCEAEGRPYTVRIRKIYKASIDYYCNTCNGIWNDGGTAYQILLDRKEW